MTHVVGLAMEWEQNLQDEAGKAEVMRLLSMETENQPKEMNQWNCRYDLPKGKS